MHRSRLIALMAVCGVAAIQLAGPAYAGGKVNCDVRTQVCTVVVTSPGRKPIRSVAQGSTNRPKPSCETRAASPQPPRSDPVWNGHQDGLILVELCWEIVQMGSHYFWAPSPPTGTPLAQVTPGELARRAQAALRAPAPVLERSPHDSGFEPGAPLTWVNLWTWVWTARSSWHALSKTASAGNVWATVTAKPMALVFDPGDGGAAVSCVGPGRAWTAVDGDGPPTGGGCGYVYRSVSADLTATLSIRWAVSWVGSGETSGRLPAMATRVSDRFAVEQVQAVNR